MGQIGRPPIVWTKELDNKLIALITAGNKLVPITVRLKICRDSINKRLREMGFVNFIDARNTLFHRDALA
jgi:hypothetical protein